MKYKKAEQNTYQEGWLLDVTYFEEMAESWNNILDALHIPASLYRYESGSITREFREMTGIAEDILTSGRYFATTPGDSITTGTYDVLLFDATGKQEKALNRQFNVFSPGLLWAKSRFLGDIHALYARDDALTLAIEEGESFFQTLGGIRLHLEAALSSELETYHPYLVGYEWFLTQHVEYTFSSEMFAEHVEHNLRHELEALGVPSSLIDALQERLENHTFSTKEALIDAIQSVLTEGYTITDRVLQALQPFVDEGRFPGYFVTNGDGLTVLQDETYPTAAAFVNALRTAQTAQGRPAVAGYRVTRQTIMDLTPPGGIPHNIPEERYRRLRSSRDLRGHDHTGISYRTAENFERLLEQELGTDAYNEIIKAHADHVAQFRNILLKYADHTRFYTPCTEAILKHGALKKGQFFPGYETVELDPQTKQVIIDPQTNQPIAISPLTDEEFRQYKEFADDPLLIQDEIYWQGEYRTDIDETIHLVLTLGTRTRGNQLDILGTVPITRRLKSRVLEETEPPMTGDDVRMLQSLLNFFDWRGWDELVLNGIFEGKTADRVKLFKKQNRGTWLQDQDKKLTDEVLKMLSIHFDDYRKALNDFDWWDGENPAPPPRHAMMDDSHPHFKKADQGDNEGWTEAAAVKLEALPAGVIAPDLVSDKRRLLLKLVEVESTNQHWLQSWRMYTSEDGALGFTQVMPFNSERYNDRTEETFDIKASLNMYRPDENLKAGAQFLNKYLTIAFSGDWTQPGDDSVALLKKALAYYNGGDKNILKNNSWQTIVASPNNLGMAEEVNYVSRFFGCPGGLDCN